MNEEWKNIDGYGDTYMVSSFGRVKSFKKKGNINGLILMPVVRFGYMQVGLHKNGKKKILRVHRLVAIAFINNTHKKPFINHINGIKSDNRIENLEWCTTSENAKHAFAIGLSKPKKGADNYMFGRTGELAPMYGRKGVLSPLFGKPSKLRGRINPDSQLVRKVKGRKPNTEYQLFENARDAERKTGAAY